MDQGSKLEISQGNEPKHIRGAGLVSAQGKMIERSCIETINNFENAAIDKYIVMPNHFNGIIVINASPRADTRP